MSNSSVIQMPKYPCQFCKKNEATQLCDFVIDYFWTSVKDEWGKMIGKCRHTCDNEMCKECAIQVAGHEFCPSCAKLHKYVLQHHDRRPRPMMAATLYGRYEK